MKSLHLYKDHYFFRTDATKALPDRVFDIGSAVAHADVIVPAMHR